MICYGQKNLGPSVKGSLLLFLPEILKKNLKFLSPVLNQVGSHFELASIPCEPASVPHEPAGAQHLYYGMLCGSHGTLAVSYGMLAGSRGTLAGSYGTLAGSKWDAFWFSTGLRNLRFFLNISGRKRSRDLVLSQLVLEFFGPKHIKS